MFDSTLDRKLTYRLSSAYDCWGQRRTLRRGTQNSIWFIDGSGLDVPSVETEPADHDDARTDRLAVLESSGRFTTTEIKTLQALVLERLTVTEIAERHGCSRQAVLARLVGNSRGQGGIVKKAHALLGR